MADERPTKTYERDGFKVHWYASRCIHSAECVRALPAVFRPNDRPWIHVDEGDQASIAAAVAACPSGALQFEQDGMGAAAVDGEVVVSPEEGRPLDRSPVGVTAVDGEVVISLEEGGPLNLRGRVRIEDPNGNTIAEGTRFALCRCGASENKPFCDNSHFRLA